MFFIIYIIIYDTLIHTLLAIEDPSHCSTGGENIQPSR